MAGSADYKVFVVAPNQRWFENWCRIDAEPEENPRDRKFVVITDPKYSSRGRHVIEGDRLIIMGLIEWDITPVVYMLLALGFREYEDSRGVTWPLVDLLPKPIEEKDGPGL